MSNRLAPERTAEIVRLIGEGVPRREIAERVGCNLSTVQSVARGLRQKAARKALRRNEPDPTGYASDIEEVYHRWLRLTRILQDQFEESIKSGAGDLQRIALAAGIATQRLLDMKAAVDRGLALPDHLPESDDDARRLVREVWWRAARKGQAGAITKLARSLGIEEQGMTQPLHIEWVDPDEPGEPADPTPAAS